MSCVDDETQDADSMVPELSTAAESAAELSPQADTTHMEAAFSQHSAKGSAESTESTSEALPAVAAEDSFTADAQGAAGAVAQFPAKGQSAFANSAFDGEDDVFKQSPYFNPMWDSGTSPEQPSRSQSPYPGSSVLGTRNEYNADSASAFQVGHSHTQCTYLLCVLCNQAFCSSVHALTTTSFVSTH